MRLAQSSRFLYCTWILFHFTEVQVLTIWKYSEGQIGVFSSVAPGVCVLLRFRCSFFCCMILCVLLKSCANLFLIHAVCPALQVTSEFYFSGNYSSSLFWKHRLFLWAVCEFSMGSQWRSSTPQRNILSVHGWWGSSFRLWAPDSSRLQVADRFLGKGLVPQNKGSLSHGSKYWFCFCAQGDQIVHSFHSFSSVSVF